MRSLGRLDEAKLLGIWLNMGSMKLMSTMIGLDSDHTLIHLLPLMRQLTISVTIKIHFVMIMIILVRQCL